MTEQKGGGEPQWVDNAISNLLRGGVLVSVAIVLAGIFVTFAHHHDYFSSRPALGELTRVGEHFPNTITGVARGVRQMHGQAIVMAGLLLLIATPVARVAFSIAVFAVEHDRLYMLITTVVLLLLLLSFALGAAG
jgi:uncharacterized membrane protein